MNENVIRTWVNPSFKACGWLFAIGTLLMPIPAILRPDTSVIGAIVVAAMFGCLAAAMWLGLVPIKLELLDTSIRVTNPYRRPRMVDIADVVSVETGPCLVLCLADGSRVSVWAVQALNWKLVFGRPGYPERVAGELTSTMKAARPGPSVPASSAPRAETRKFGILMIAGAALSAVLYALLH